MDNQTNKEGQNDEVVCGVKLSDIRSAYEDFMDRLTDSSMPMTLVSLISRAWESDTNNEIIKSSMKEFSETPISEVPPEVIKLPMPVMMILFRFAGGQGHPFSDMKRWAVELYGVE